MVLIKEYRIPVPCTIDEFKIGHLYMIYRASKEAVDDKQAGVCVLQTKTVEKTQRDGSVIKGIYRRRVFRVGRSWKLPAWAQKLIPKNAEIVEETHDFYPHITTLYTCPLLGERFRISVDTKYVTDEEATEMGSTTSVDFINIAGEKVEKKSYKKEEDPVYFTSKKTNRGPLKKNWVSNRKQSDQALPLIWAIKNVEVEFNYWGIQGKVEDLIHQVFRGIYLKTHQQAFCWIDEWIDLSLDEVNELANFEGGSPVSPRSNSLSSSSSSTSTSTSSSSSSRLSRSNSLSNNNNNNNNLEVSSSLRNRANTNRARQESNTSLKAKL